MPKTERLSLTEVAARWGMEYVPKIPRAVPPGRVLVHNPVRTIWVNQEQGRNGFRFWLSEPSDRWTRCDCGWAPHLPETRRD
jgi:hypothetical protein